MIHHTSLFVETGCHQPAWFGTTVLPISTFQVAGIIVKATIPGLRILFLINRIISSILLGLTRIWRYRCVVNKTCIVFMKLLNSKDNLIWTAQIP
jgi:hypothetical protein